MRKLPVIALFWCMAFSTSYAQKQFWGTATAGGLYGDGFIFKTDSIGDNLEIVHDFQSAVDGKNISALLLASNNKLYGLASSGGQGGGADVFSGGTFFEYDLTTDQFRVLEHFGPANTHLPGVTMPRAEGFPALTEVSPGIIFGLMRQGKYVFSYNVATGVFTQPFAIPTYQGGTYNSTLQNQLCQTFYKAADNLLYVATATNSSCPIGNPYMGSIMRVNPADNTIVIRHRANCLVTFGYTYNGFFAEANGKLYGTTNAGGDNYVGVIFAYNPADNTYTKVHDFANSVSSYEATSLVRAGNGKLYGTAHGGGIPEPNLGLNAGGGVLFEFNIATNTFTKKHDFTLAGQSIYDMGIFPSGLISSTNGKLYGATQYGVFEFDPSTDAMRVAGRFEGQGFAPSFVQVCRKPVYQPLAQTTHTVCNGASIDLDLASDNATTITWKHNNVVDAAQTTTTLSFDAFGAANAGTWVCTLVNECGTTVAPAITLVLDEPAAPMVSPGGPLIVCEGETVTLSAPAGFDSYAWSTGETSREIVVSENGDYAVRVSNGCESPLSATVSVTIRPLPAAVTITAEGAVDFCAGTSVTLSAPEGFSSYAWSNGETTPAIDVSEGGDYSVKVNNGCESPASEAVSVTVHPLPPAPGPIAESGDVLTASGGTGTYAWTWNDEPLDEVGAALQVTESGTYKVYSVSAEGCRSDGFASASVIVNGTETSADDIVTIYPNPSPGMVYLNVNNTFVGQADIFLTNVTGAVVFRQSVSIEQETTAVHFSNVPAGLYDLMIRKGTNVIHRKIIVY